MSSDVHPPLVVLSSHRSGSSAFMGLLVRSGLEVGPVIPPAPDNPKGFFESIGVLAANKTLLEERERDWTCPPPSIDHRTVDREALEEALQGIERTRPWGFKDPRTLFTLPAWAPVTGPSLLVGVHRDTRSIARSLAARSDLSEAQAMAVAAAYVERLAEVHRMLRFPVVSFDAPPDEFLERTRRIAELLGLAWDEDAASEWFSEALIHHKQQAPTAEHDEYLTAAAREAFHELPAFTAATVVRVWDASPATTARSLPLDLGPRALARREEIHRWLVHGLGTTGVTATLDTPGTSPPPLPASDSVSVPWDPDGGPSYGVRPTVVVAGSVLDDVPPSSLEAFLVATLGDADVGAVLGTGGWILDAVRVPETHRFPVSGVVASRHQSPYLHHRVEIEGMLARHGYTLVGVETTAGGRTNLAISVGAPPSGEPRLAPGPILRSRLAESLDRVDRLEAELSEVQSALETTRSELTSRTHELDVRTSELREATVRTETVSEELAVLRSAATATEDQLAAARTELRAVRDELRVLKREHAAARKELRRVQKSHDRLLGRRSIRAALWLASLTKPIFRLARAMRRRAPVSTPASVGDLTEPTPRRTREEVVRGLAEARPMRQPVSTPLVSVIILTRDGADHLERLLPRLEETAYRPFEVIVIDNASSDRSNAVLRREWKIDLRIVRNESNSSFSAGNNQGVRHARGDVLLFLNNDIEPLNDGWLAEMVMAFDRETTVSAVGALLVYPERGDPYTDLTVQHAGVAIELQDGSIHARNISTEDPLAPELAETSTVPAVTAAALMVRREDFDAVGGFDERYVYGAEDVDLCLRLHGRGEIVLAGRAVAFHHESATQNLVENDVIRINRLGNWRHFAEVWSPTLSRSVLASTLRGDGRWTGRTSRKVAITLTQDDITKGWGDYYTAHELGEALAEDGWEVIYGERFEDRWYSLPDDVDLVISLLDSFDVRRSPPNAYTIAWVRNWLERWMSHEWFAEFDLVVTSSRSAAQIVRGASRFDPPILPLAADHEAFAPGPPHPTFVADYAFTGNNWGVGRDIIPLLNVRPGERFLLFGKGWDQDPRMGRYWRGHLPHDLLPDLYRSVRIVLDDTAGPTLPHGFVNGRVFEALAAGALVLTDNVEGSRELFDGRLPTYRDASELRRLLDLYLGDESERTRLVDELRAIVVERHTYRLRARQFVDVAVESIERPAVAVKIGVPREDEARFWGDYHFATALVDALSNLGFRGQVDLLPDWDDPSRQDVDVVVHLRGLSTYAPKPSHVNVLWIISHPDDVTPEECDKYDLVCVASESFARHLRDHTSTRVVFLPQATDPRRFADAEPDPALSTPLLFVGNSRGQQRPAVEWAIAEGLEPVVYGSRWDGIIDRRFVRAEYFPNEELGRLYASAGIVLNDHWPDMRDRGFVSNRILDALASGSLVVSDRVSGLESLVGAAVPTFDSPEELADIVERFSNDPELRARTIEKGRSLVLREHTFAARAGQLEDLVRPLLAGRARDLDGHVFEGAPATPHSVQMDDLPIPPDELRFMDQSVDEFLEWGDEYVDMLQSLASLDPDESVLDVGCGYGRVAHALLRRGHRGSYLGVDLLARQVRWCTDALTPASGGRFRFRHIDVHNERYNPEGTTKADEVSLDFGDHHDVVVLTSVFTHMYDFEIEHYLHELATHMTPGARMMATFFLMNESQRTSEEAGSSTYPLDHQLGPHSRCWNVEDPLHVIAHSEEWVRTAFDRAGLEIVSLHEGSWCGRTGDRPFQDTIVARRPAESR